MLSTAATKLASAPFAQRYPRVAVLVLVAVLVGGGALLLLAEHQWQVAAVLLGFGALAVVSERTQAGAEIVNAYRGHRSFGNGAALTAMLGLIAAFREDHYAILMIATVALYATACIGLNIQMAFGGVVNFAGAAFFSVGAYTAALLANTALPHVAVLALSGLTAGVLGLCLLAPVLRTRGHYAALVTIAFGLLLRSFLEVNDALGGPQGLKVAGLELFGVSFNDVGSIGPWELSFYVPYAVVAVLIFAGAAAFTWRLENSWIGVSLDAVRTDEVAASAFGLSAARWKATAFLLGNVVIGLAGAAYGMMNGFVNPNGAGLGESLLLISIIVLGGLGNIWGSVVAAAIILVIPEKLQAIQEYRMLIFSVLVLLILRYRPKGILPRPVRVLARFTGRKGENDV